MRGLQATSNDANLFTILAVDHGASLASTIRPLQQALRQAQEEPQDRPTSPETVIYEQMVATKRTILSQLATHASAVLIDPIYGLAPAVLNGALPGRCRNAIGG